MSLKINIIHAKNPSVGKDTAKEKKDALKTALPKIEMSILNEPVEHIYFLGSSGQIIKKETGKETYCQFDLLCETAHEMAGRGSIIITHNHPAGANPVTPTLSPQDIHTATYINVNEIRAVSQNTQKVYSLRRPKDGWLKIEGEEDFKKISYLFTKTINAPYFSGLNMTGRADAVAAVLYNEIGYDIVTLDIGGLNEGL